MCDFRSAARLNNEPSRSTMHRRISNASLIAGITSVLAACQGAARPAPPVDRDDAETLDETREATKTPPTATASSSPAANPADAGVEPFDSGVNIASDAASVPIIGVIDPSEVVVVEVEAAAPPIAACAQLTARPAQSAAVLPDGSLPLSVTSDGTAWAYAVPITNADASAPHAEVDAEAASNDVESAYAIHVANASSSWTFSLPGDQDPMRGAALDAMGQHLVTTLSDTRGFVMWKLDADADRFEVSVNQPFVRLNALALQGGVRFEKPVFSTSGTRLYVQELDANPAITQLVLRDGQWETELRITNSALQLQDFSISAASGDELTLFLWSATEERTVAWWRPRPDADFDASLPIDASRVYSVSADCNDWWTLSAP
jgi:hypothetical protein